MAAFIGVNNLNKNFERFLVDFQGEYKSNFNTLTEIGALFIAGFTALSATIIPYTLIKAGHVYGPCYTTSWRLYWGRDDGDFTRLDEALSQSSYIFCPRPSNATSEVISSCRQSLLLLTLLNQGEGLVSVKLQYCK